MAEIDDLYARRDALLQKQEMAKLYARRDELQTKLAGTEPVQEPVQAQQQQQPNAPMDLEAQMNAFDARSDAELPTQEAPRSTAEDNDFYDYTDQAIQGLTLGTGSHLQSALKATMAKLGGSDDSWVDEYKTLQKGGRERRLDFEERKPVSSLAANFGGGVLFPANTAYKAAGSVANQLRNVPGVGGLLDEAAKGGQALYNKVTGLKKRALDPLRATGAMNTASNAIAKGAGAGAFESGLYGGATAEEGQFWEGVKSGAVPGALMGAGFGAAGQATRKIFGNKINQDLMQPDGSQTPIHMLADPGKSKIADKARQQMTDSYDAPNRAKAQEASVLDPLEMKVEKSAEAVVDNAEKLRRKIAQDQIKIGEQRKRKQLRLNTEGPGAQAIEEAKDAMRRQTARELAENSNMTSVKSSMLAETTTKARQRQRDIDDFGNTKANEEFQRAQDVQNHQSVVKLAIPDTMPAEKKAEILNIADRGKQFEELKTWWSKEAFAGVKDTPLKLDSQIFADLGKIKTPSLLRASGNAQKDAEEALTVAFGPEQAANIMAGTKIKKKIPGGYVLELANSMATASRDKNIDARHAGVLRKLSGNTKNSITKQLEVEDLKNGTKLAPTYQKELGAYRDMVTYEAAQKRVQATGNDAISPQDIFTSAQKDYPTATGSDNQVNLAKTVHKQREQATKDLASKTKNDTRSLQDQTILAKEHIEKFMAMPISKVPGMKGEISKLERAELVRDAEYAIKVSAAVQKERASGRNVKQSDKKLWAKKAKEAKKKLKRMKARSIHGNGPQSLSTKAALSAAAYNANIWRTLALAITPISSVYNLGKTTPMMQRWSVGQTGPQRAAQAINRGYETSIADLIPETMATRPKTKAALEQASTKALSDALRGAAIRQQANQERQQ